jgi:hypothetical protein
MLNKTDSEDGGRTLLSNVVYTPTNPHGATSEKTTV